MAIRLKDIARDLDVSVMTVSKALRPGSDISDARRELILRRMRELNYRPNLNARSLATGQSQIAALLVPDILNPFFTEFAKSLGTHLRKQNYGLIVGFTEEDPELERAEIRTMIARGADVLVLASSLTSPRQFGDLLPFQKPVLLVDRAIAALPAPFLGVDDYQGGVLATEHLIALGRRRIAYVGGPKSSSKATRQAGFESVMRRHKLPLLPGHIAATPTGSKASDETGYALMQQLLECNPVPDAVFCHNDVVAVGAIKAILRAGLRIPGEIAVIGFDNVSFSRFLPIPLSSVDQPTPLLGEMAARMAIELATKGSHGSKRTMVAPSLVIRESTGAPSTDQKRTTIAESS